MTKDQTGTALITAQLRSDYVFRPARGPAREFWVLLHGYELSGAFMMQKLAGCFPDDVALLAPNGPFPVPRRKSDGAYRVGFAWYFWDPRVDQYYVGMDAAFTLIAQLVREKNLAGVPLNILGYSQGGYLAPFVAAHLASLAGHPSSGPEIPSVKRMIGVAADFLTDEVPALPGVEIDWVLGLADEVVEAPGVQRHLAALRTAGATLREHLLPGQGHLISSQMTEALRAIVAKSTGTR